MIRSSHCLYHVISYYLRARKTLARQPNIEHFLFLIRTFLANYLVVHPIERDTKLGRTLLTLETLCVVYSSLPIEYLLFAINDGIMTDGALIVCFLVVVVLTVGHPFVVIVGREGTRTRSTNEAGGVEALFDGPDNVRA